MERYSNGQRSFDENGNTTSDFMIDVINHLYKNENQYNVVIDYAKKANPNEYLKVNIPNEVVQKYGALNTNWSTVGIIYAPKPYGVAIYTKDVPYAQRFISELNTVVYHYALNKRI
nr:hypothetical protein [Atopobacter phocae]